MTSSHVSVPQALQFAIGVEHDDERNREAHMVIQDLLFKLSQRNNKVSHLEKKVEGLQ